MNRQPEDPSGQLIQPVSGQPRGEDAVGDLIRELAAGWHMPPPTPDSRPWPERIRPRRTGGWFWRRSGRAVVSGGAMALLLTVVAAIVAVWLALPRHTGPADGAAAPPPAAATHTPRPTVDPALRYSTPPTSTPGPTLPPYAVLGAPLPAERVIVDAGSGPALFDIGSGGLTATAPTSSTSYDRLFSLPDGSFLCTCVASVGTLDQAGHNALTTVTVTLRWLGADGTPKRSVILPNYVGRADPVVANEPEHAGVTSSLSPDGAILYIGWVVEHPPVWHGGIDVVDLAAGQVVQTLSLPDVPNQVASASVGVAGASVTPAPPTPNQVASASVNVAGASVTVAPGGTLAMIGRSMWYSGGSTQGSWHATASVRGGHLGPLSALAGGAGGLDGGTCAGSGGPAGFVTATSYFEICHGDAGAIVRRVEVSGRPLGDTVLGGSTAVGFGLGTVVDPAHHLLYVWEPFGRHLLRVDLATGQITGRGTLPTASASAGPFADVAHAIAAWLAPAVAAKMYINPSLAMSHDGSRLFAIGTATADPLGPGGGSTGVWVFDTSSLVTVAHWAPVADYISLTLNRDGSLLLVAGMPGADAAGDSNDQAASVTIYDAASGAVRAIAGQVQPNSAGWVMFPSLTP